MSSVFEKSRFELVGTLQGHSSSVCSMSFSPDGTKVASGSSDKTVKLWDVTSGECLQTLEGHSDIVHSVSFSPDGTKVASGSDDETVKGSDFLASQLFQNTQRSFYFSLCSTHSNSMVSCTLTAMTAR